MAPAPPASGGVGNVVATVMLYAMLCIDDLRARRTAEEIVKTTGLWIIVSLADDPDPDTAKMGADMLHFMASAGDEFADMILEQLPPSSLPSGMVGHPILTGPLSSAALSRLRLAKDGGERTAAIQRARLVGVPEERMTFAASPPAKRARRTAASDDDTH